MYKRVHFEISGVCNAQCPWCVNGRNRPKSYTSRFIPPQEFQKAIDRLFEESLIDKNTIIRLFNYGEPLLHPSLQEIMKILVDYKLQYVFSTNASKFIAFNHTLIENLQLFMISIPGFSQESYDKIHGFDFDEILKNIDRWIELIGHNKIQENFMCTSSIWMKSMLHRCISDREA
jgi:MoaA/NifB/PqqE/SkfB family radical SAM enzyme